MLHGVGKVLCPGKPICGNLRSEQTVQNIVRVDENSPNFFNQCLCLQIFITHHITILSNFINEKEGTPQKAPNPPSIAMFKKYVLPPGS